MYIHVEESMKATTSRCMQFLKLAKGEAGHLVPGLVRKHKQNCSCISCILNLAPHSVLFPT